ncbi:MAG: DUF1223 domain-containing protein [Deltaproteobacteria bacterium]|nr:DUF1223 domain-containing protein [Deltaproteobacteria bacterium]
MKNKIFILILLISGLKTMNATAQTFSSGITKVPLIELYTSEGCSSCPPADRWLSQLKTRENLWQDFVPIAFHVDYWDYIGWSDPFAKPANSLRQRRYRSEGNIKGVYTPGIIFMGQEWRSWYIQKSIPKVDWSEVGELSVDIENNVAHVRFQPTVQQPTKLKAHLSILGFELTTQVKRGENRGKRLGHEFVSLAHIKTTVKSDQGIYKWTINLPKQYTVSKKQLGVAVWVSTTDRQQPIQATGGWLR